MKNSMKEVIKKIGIVILLPIIIGFVFFILAIKNVYKLTDIGSFMGGTLSYIGTVGLGIISVWQTKKNRESHKEWQDKQEKEKIIKEKQQIQPYLFSKSIIPDLKELQGEKVESIFQMEYNEKDPTIKKTRVEDLKKAISHNESESTSLIRACNDFQLNNYLLKYDIINVGAGHALDVQILLNDSIVVNNMALIKDSKWEFFLWIIFKSGTNCFSEEIDITFRYRDVKQLAYFEQKETIQVKYDDEKNSFSHIVQESLAKSVKEIMITAF